MSECLQILPRNWRNGASNLILDIILVRFTHERWFATLTKDGCAVAPRIVVFDEIWFALLTNALREGLINKVKSLSPWLVSVRRDLHKTPELGLQEFLTKEKIIKYLDEIGIDYITYPDHTGIMAYINKNAKNTVAIRADIDALPITETSDKSYKSTHNGKMHACGHDAHTAILLGSCKVLYDMNIKDQVFNLLKDAYKILSILIEKYPEIDNLKYEKNEVEIFLNKIR